MDRWILRTTLWLSLSMTGWTAPLMPDHLPAGARAPLEAGQRFTLAATRVFLAPSFTDSSIVLHKDCPARATSVRDGFYQLTLEAVDGQPGRNAWVYRSELEVKEAASRMADPLPARLAEGLATRPLAAGDTLTLQGPLLYKETDLLGEHEPLAGRQLLTVLVAEDGRGFLKVRAGKRTGWLHRAELPEERRRTRP